MDTLLQLKIENIIKIDEKILIFEKNEEKIK
jgi:hypothetical protein